MEIKNIIRNKKGAETVENVFMMIIMAVAIFAGMYLFWVDAMGKADITMPSEYSETYGNLSRRQATIDNKTREIRDTITALEEAKGVELVWTAITGVGKVLLLLPSVIVVGTATFMDLTGPFGILTAWVMVFIITATLIMIVFAMIRATSGRTNI